MSIVEIAAAKQIPTAEGVLAPLQVATARGPLACAADFALTAELARVATAQDAAAHWAELAVEAIRGFQAPEQADSVAAPATTMSGAALTAIRSTIA
jgi:hypothetical protein